MTPWYQRKEITRQLPMLQRLWATYARNMRSPKTGRIRGGSFLLRTISRLSGGVGSFPIAVNNLHSRVNLNDLDFGRVLSELAEPSEECAAVLNVLSPGDTFIDVGANYGAFSLLAAQRVGANGRVFTVEAQPALAKMLSDAMADNKFNHAKVFNIAAGKTSGEIEMHVPRFNSALGSLHANYVVNRYDCEHVRVRLEKLDATLPWRDGFTGKVVLKIDVEGNEIGVLEGANELIAAHRPLILCEINPMALAAGGHKPADLLSAIKSLGYHTFSLPSDFPEVIDEANINTNHCTNIFAVHDSRATSELNRTTEAHVA